ncbi:hypothetical protein D6783_01120 [Candidatus Woesearchaeota archaeon]|nr:MAG: hypothetical protein D6783_01120 [Candidatus Woesearchaeota archaeon]
MVEARVDAGGRDEFEAAPSARNAEEGTRSGASPFEERIGIITLLEQSLDAQEVQHASRDTAPSERSDSENYHLASLQFFQNIEGLVRSLNDDAFEKMRERVGVFQYDDFGFLREKDVLFVQNLTILSTASSFLSKVYSHDALLVNKAKQLADLAAYATRQGLSSVREQYAQLLKRSAALERRVFQLENTIRWAKDELRTLHQKYALKVQEEDAERATNT